METSSDIKIIPIYSVSVAWTAYMEAAKKGWNLNKATIRKDINDKLCLIAIPHSINGCTYIEFISKELLIENK